MHTSASAGMVTGLSCANLVVDVLRCVLWDHWSNAHQIVQTHAEQASLDSPIDDLCDCVCVAVAAAADIFALLERHAESYVLVHIPIPFEVQ